MANLKELDPVQGLVDYVLDIKPYHTKIMEVLIEYVHTELVDIRITDATEMVIDFTYPPEKIEFVCEEDGYDTDSWGSGDRLSITAPNISISFEDYPAINTGTNTVTINGDQTKDVRVGDQVFISSFVDDYTNVYKIFDVIPGAAGAAAFIIKESTIPPEFLIPGYTFRAYEAGDNNGTYSVAAGSPGVTTDGTHTTIPVQQSISLSTVAGSIGLVTTLGTNNGYFTVLSLEYNGGSIDSWPDPSDPSTYTVGNEPHTIITLVEPLATPVFPGSPGLVQVHVAYLTTQPVPIEGALHYSRADKIYAVGSPSTVEQIPNEGTNRLPLVGVTLTGGSPTAHGAFVLDSDFTGSNIFVGDAIKIDSSSGNNGTYTIVSITYNGGLNQTTFEVSELVNNATVDGYGSVFIPANVFIIDENRAAQFTQGRQFDVQGGTNGNTFTVLNSHYSQGKTYVRVHESVFDVGLGDYIYEINNGFVVSGDQTLTYPVGTSFNVIGSTANDGIYVVSGSPGPSYNILTGRTTIPVADTLDTTPGGELHLPIVGNLQRHPYGFDESSPICGIVPETVVAVYITDTLKFSGLGININDDLIVYNMENSDQGGFDVPIRTIIDSIQPVILSQPTPPFTSGSPALAYDRLWFDTSLTTPVLKQWVGYDWKIIQKAWWFDTSTNLLYYRAMQGKSGSPIVPLIDTGWVLDSLRMPGFSDFLPAIGEKEVTAEEDFVASEISPGVPQTTYTTVNSVPGSPPDTSLFKVTINGVLAGYTLNSANSFTVTSPAIIPGDIVQTTFFDRTATELNAHVGAFDVIPHTVYHSGVTVDGSNNAYIVNGGNYLDRFVSFNSIIGYNTNDSGSPALHDIEIGTYNATSLPVVAVDGIVDTFTINGDYSWLFTVGRVFRNKSENNYFEFTVVSSVAAGSPIQTVITVAESVTETTIVDIAGSPIQQSYSRDLGVITGAVYDPATVTTLLAPSTTVDSNVDAFSYIWVGPVRFDVGLNPTDLAHNTILDGLGISNELLGFPDSYDIIDTNLGVGGSPNGITGTFTLHYEQVMVAGSPAIETLVPVDLGQLFSPGTIFTVAGSYSNSVPSNIESNDADYVVKSVFFDEGGTGDTIITVERNFNNIPPYNSFTVVEVSNNIGAGSPDDLSNTITLSGDHVTLLSGFASGKFRMDQPLVSANSLYNIITATNIELVGGNTVITVQEEFIDEAYTGPLGLIDVKYRAEIYFDELNTAGSPNEYEHGRIIREAFKVGHSDTNTAASTIIDDLLFGWGNVLRWPIINVNVIGSPASSIDLFGDFTAIMQPNDRVTIKGGTGMGSPNETMNGEYEVFTTSYNAGTGVSTVQLANPIITFDPPLVNVNVPILSTGAGSPVVRTFIIDGEDGLHVNFLRPGTTFTVEDGLGSPASSPNEGTYTVVSAVHDSGNDTITVTTVEPIPSDSAAGYVQYIKKNAGFVEMENIDITPWFQYTIKEIRPISSDILINGNATGSIQSGQEVRALNTLANDGTFTASNAPTFSALTNTTVLPVAEPLFYGENPIHELPDTNVVKVLGTAANYLSAGGSPNSGDEFIITGSTGNDGTYIVQGATYDGTYSRITLTTGLPDTTPDGIGQFRDRGGWIESLRYQGIALYFTDSIAITTAEEADAAILLTAGSFIGSWDYPLWDVGSFDENVETVIHLYSNTF